MEAPWVSVIIALIALVLTLVANAAIVAYAYGALHQIVVNLREIVANLQATVKDSDEHIGKLENRLIAIEKTCELRHG